MKTQRKRVSPPVLLLVALVACATRTTGLEAQTLTLQAAVDSALATHPTIRGVQARVQQVAEGTSATRATRWPSVGLDMSLTHFQEPMLAQPIHSFNPTDLPRFDETLLQGRLGARYTVFGDGRGSRIDGAEASLEEARAHSRVTEEALIESVTAAYLGVLSSRAVLESATARVTSLAEEEARARMAFAAGTAAEVEILRAAAATQDARAQRTTAATSVTLAERGLARLMGRPAAGLLGAAMVDVALIEHPDTRDVADDARVVRAERSVLASEARLSEHRSDWYPRFDLTAGLLDYASLEGSHVFEWQAGVQMSWASSPAALAGPRYVERRPSCSPPRASWRRRACRWRRKRTRPSVRSRPPTLGATRSRCRSPNGKSWPESSGSRSKPALGSRATCYGPRLDSSRPELHSRTHGTKRCLPA